MIRRRVTTLKVEGSEEVEAAKQTTMILKSDARFVNYLVSLRDSS